MDIIDIIGKVPLYLRVQGSNSFFGDKEARLFLDWCEKTNRACREEEVSKDRFNDLKNEFFSCYEAGI